MATNEKVRHMPPSTSTSRPEQPERLAGQPDHLRIEVQQHRVMSFQMRFAGQPGSRCRHPVVAGDRPLAGIRPDLPDRGKPLEAFRPAGRQRLTAPDQVAVDVLDVENGNIAP